MAQHRTRPIPKRFKKLFCYVRISTDPQVDGNGVERQREAMQREILRRVTEMGVQYEEIVWLADFGRSAYHGHHITRGMMGELMEHARFAAEKLAKVALFESPRALLDLYCLEPGQEQRVHQHGPRRGTAS